MINHKVLAGLGSVPQSPRFVYCCNLTEALRNVVAVETSSEALKLNLGHWSDQLFGQNGGSCRSSNSCWSH